MNNLFYKIGFTFILVMLFKTSIAQVDSIAPQLTLLGANPLRIQIYCTNKAYVDAGVTAIDNKDGILTDSIIKTGNVNTLKVGKYIIQYQVKDAAGNSSQIIRNVIIEDKKSPIIIKPKDTTEYIQFQKNLPVSLEVWDDSCKNNALKKQTELINTSVNTDILGTYFEIWKVADTSGNVSDEVIIPVKVVPYKGGLGLQTINKNDLLVYPTFVNHFLNISIATPSNNPIKIEIYEANGRLIKKETLVPFNNTYSINLTHLVNGLLILNIEIDGKIFREKIIKY